MIGFIGVGEAYIFIMVRGKDDICRGVAMGVFVSFGSIVVAAVADVKKSYRMPWI